MAVNRIWMLNAPTGVIGTAQKHQIVLGYSGIAAARLTTSISSVRIEEEFKIKLSIGGQEMADKARGTTVIVEAEVTQHTPFGSDAYFDPAGGLNITVSDRDGTVVVDNLAMTKQTTGKYFYRWQSVSTSEVGPYETKVTADDTSWDGVVIKTLFRLY